MTYEETIEYLFNSAPLFQHVGKDAYKEGLDNTHQLDAHFNHPHQKFKTIHVAGTNGKGPVRTPWPLFSNQQVTKWDFTPPLIWWISANASE